jgi:hypothetical protein
MKDRKKSTHLDATQILILVICSLENSLKNNQTIWRQHFYQTENKSILAA